MKFIVVVPQSDWDREGVPAYLQRAVRMLNDALDCNRIHMGKLCETREIMIPHVAERFENHAGMVITEYAIGDEVHLGLSVLGLLNSVLRQPPFRLYVEIWDPSTKDCPSDGECVYKRFGIYKETP